MTGSFILSILLLLYLFGPPRVFEGRALAGGMGLAAVCACVAALAWNRVEALQRAGGGGFSCSRQGRGAGMAPALDAAPGAALRSKALGVAGRVAWLRLETLSPSALDRAPDTALATARERERVMERARRRFKAKQAPVHEHSREIACLPGAWRLGPSARTRDPR